MSNPFAVWSPAQLELWRRVALYLRSRFMFPGRRTWERCTSGRRGSRERPETDGRRPFVISSSSGEGGRRDQGVRQRRRRGDRRSLPRPDHNGPLEFSYFPAISYSTSVSTAPKSWCFCFVSRALPHTFIESTRLIRPRSSHIRNHSSEPRFEDPFRRVWRLAALLPHPHCHQAPYPSLVLDINQLSLESSQSFHEGQAEVRSLLYPRQETFKGSQLDQGSSVSG